VLWWLLRVMPPRPRRIEFPPTALLLGHRAERRNPSHTPWWLTALRLAAATLVILAARGRSGIRKPVLPAIALRLSSCSTDGWSAASSWDIRIKAADELIANADATGAAFALVPLVRARARHHTDAGGHRARGAAQLVPKPYSIVGGSKPCPRSSISSKPPATARSPGCRMA